ACLRACPSLRRPSLAGRRNAGPGLLASGRGTGVPRPLAGHRRARACARDRASSGRRRGERAQSLGYSGFGSHGGERVLSFKPSAERREKEPSMPPHSLGSGTISFGLVSIPVRLYTAASSGNVAFNQLHGVCGSRIRQQTFCPTCNKTVERAELVRGYEFAKDQYVRVADDELKALEGEASKIIDIAEFVPLADVDPIYFEKTYYLGPDKGGEKPYRLLSDAMEKAGQVALARYVMRGKESLVLIRAAQGGLMLHTMYFADAVQDFGEVDEGASAKI